MIIQFDASEYTMIENEEDFHGHYPREKEGHYRPQPWIKPDKYPCLFKELTIMNNPQGADHVILTYIYDFILKSDLDDDKIYNLKNLWYKNG
jgi:hypothetical protein